MNTIKKRSDIRAFFDSFATPQNAQSLLNHEKNNKRSHKMTETQIKQTLNDFANEIFYKCNSIDIAKDIKKRLDAFCAENNVTVAQMQEFAESGAGEMLYMLVNT